MVLEFCLLSQDTLDEFLKQWRLLRTFDWFIILDPGGAYIVGEPSIMILSRREFLKIYGILEILMRDYGWIASSVVLKVDDRICTIKVNDTFTANGVQVRIADLYMPPQYRYPVVKLTSITENNEAQQTFLPIGEKNEKEIYGSKIIFADINSVPGVLVSVKNNPSIPLTFVTIFFFSAGMILVIFRIIGRMVSN